MQTTGALILENDHRYYSRQSHVMAVSGDYDGALKSLDMAIRLNPEMLSYRNERIKLLEILDKQI